MCLTGESYFIKGDMQMLEEAKIYLAKNEASLLEQAIILV
jgi:hypothetical protein